MKYAVALILLFSLSLVSAEISVTKTDKTLSEPVFDVSGDQGILITPRVNVGTTNVFINETLIESFSELNAGETYVIPSELGMKQVMIRSQISDTFTWENYDVTSENDPMYLAYVTYDKDKKRLYFAVKGVTFIHINQLDSAYPSTNEKFTGYSALYNGQYDLECYPSISTGRPLTFSCVVNNWPQTLNLEVNVGMMEEYEVNVVALVQNEVAVEEPEPSFPTEEVEEQVTPNQGMEETADENEAIVDNIPMANNISMTDTIPSQPSALPHTMIIIFGLLFIVVIVILYVDSHHKHQSKKKGVRLGSQKQVSQKSIQETAPRYADVEEPRKKKTK